jgi:RND family efflux transporter MFP subunit
VVAVVVVALGLGWWAIHLNTSAPANANADDSAGAAGGAVRVEVVHPTKGGLGRTVSQPGIVHAFNKASLYAKLSGYLIRQKVDIGDPVKKGELLAEIDIPELFKSAEQAKAALEQARAKLKQMQAHVLTAEADRETAASQVQVADADIAKFTSSREFRQKELARITGLFKQQAVQGELVDEEQQKFDAAVAAERSGRAALSSSKAALSASAARVEQARADADAAQADVAAAQADLDKAEVLLEYTRITSPYDGVITLRSFHDGDFIRSASEGGTVPVLAVKQNDLMRVVILVPDLDVPFVQKGAPVSIKIDALRGRTFEGKVARFADSENEQKLMRTEVDLPNPDNLLRDGMYGTATLHLAASSDHMLIPSSSLIEQDGEGHGAVFLAKGDKAHHQPVQVALDNGSQVEVVDGLSPDDLVVVRYSGTLAEGTPVQISPAKAE